MTTSSPTNIQRQRAVLWPAVIVIAALTGWSMWQSAHRTVRLDDPARGGAASLPDMRININTAGASELAMLPGIGPALAERIVEDRTKHGPFKSVDDLDRVKGIGKAIVERLKPHAMAVVPAVANDQRR